MKTFYFGFFAVFGLVYLTYLTWLSGYRAGYDEGNTKAWVTARKTLAPHLIDPMEEHARPTFALDRSVQNEER